MTYKKVTLTMAARMVIRTLITQAGHGKLSDSRNIRDIRRELKLREAEKQIDAMTEEGKAATLDLLMEEEAVEYEVPHAALSWLNDLLQAHDWSKMHTQNGQEITIPVDLALMEVVADLSDAIAGAIAK